MEDKKTHLDRGRILAVQGKYEEAIEEYREALNIDPNCKQARVNLRFAYWMMGKFKDIR